jgi:hypothetical protein
VKERHEALLGMVKRNPEEFWKQLQTKKMVRGNKISGLQWLAHAKQIYEK